MILGRVPRSKIASLRGEDWEYFTGGDGLAAKTWTRNMREAKPVLERPGKLGMTGAVYIPAQRRYLMVGWYYPAGGGKLKDAATETVWDFYESFRPWTPGIVSVRSISNLRASTARKSALSLSARIGCTSGQPVTGTTRSITS